MNRRPSQLLKIGRDGVLTARTVGLRYAGCGDQGIFRKGAPGRFHYVDHDGRRIRDAATLGRIQRLVLPPAWQDVWISPFENGHLQATGIDLRGRKQYRYHSDWNAIRNESKFFRISRFASCLPALRDQVERDLKRHGMPYEKVVALVVKLMETTHIRIGNKAYKRLYGSFGLTTLHDRHVQTNGSHMTFSFKGKKGVKHEIGLDDPRLMRLVVKCREIPGHELFQYYDHEGRHHSIGSADVNNYLKQVTGEDFTAKDFRLWAGTVQALEAFLECEPPASEADCKRKVAAVLDQVARKLGNTRTVCRKYYVHPTVIASFESGSIRKYRPTTHTGRLAPTERALVKLLDNEETADLKKGQNITASHRQLQRRVSDAGINRV
ncbi:MAG TPA: hypothetical protein VK183_06230 [Flavobacterium sp.]|nr:hypothetical protein [Flavobacterium sp.]